MAERGKQFWKYSIPGTCILLHAILSLLHLPTVSGNQGYVLTQMMNWFEAREACLKDHGRDLFIPESKVNVNNMNPNTYYWVGGQETAQWKWTDDKPLFTHLGYIHNHPYYTMKNIPGNCVLECYRQCNSYLFIGMSEQRCFCFNESVTSSLMNSEDTFEMSCPGNPEDYCGNTDLISVYKIDARIDLQSSRHQCAVAYVNYDYYGNYVTLKSRDCSFHLQSVCSDNNQKPRCSGNMCKDCHYTDWKTSKRSCNLVTATTVNITHLLEVCQAGWSYWIGLYKTVTRKWNNGKDINFDFMTHTDASQKCLAIWWNGDGYGLTARWISCNGSYKALCGEFTDTTASVTESTTSSILITRDTTSSTTVSTTSTLFPFTSSTAETTERPLKTNLAAVEDYDYGLYVGSGIGFLLILALCVGMVVFFKRREKLCFKREEKKRTGFYTATEYIDFDDITSTQDQVQVRRDASGEPQVSTATKASVRLQENDLYVTDVYSKVVRLENRKTQNIPNELRHSVPLNTDAEYSVPKKYMKECLKKTKAANSIEENEYNFTRQNQHVVPDDANCYHRLGAEFESPYDTAGSMPVKDDFDSSYNHLDSTGLEINKSALESENGNEKESADYYNIEATATGGYSNKGFVTDNQDKGSVEGEGDENVYTLAKAI